MKKIFILFLILISLLFFNTTFSESQVGSDPIVYPECTETQGCYCNDSTYSYLDQVAGTCIGVNQISYTESVNMNNIKNITSRFNLIKTQTIPNFIFLSSDTRNKLTDFLDSYYNQNSLTVTSTIENIPREQRDLYFGQRYSSYIAISKAVNIFDKYNNLGSSIQSLITLLNTTESYIQNSSLDVNTFIYDIQNSESQLRDYINTINDDLNDLYSLISNFNINNTDSFNSFIESSQENRGKFNTRMDQYVAVRESIVDLAISAIQAVEAVYNVNSSITANPSKIYNDGSISVVTVTLKDSLKNPVPGKKVILSSSKSIIISPTSIETNENGIAEFNVSADKIGYISLDATIEDEDVIISGSYLIEVIENPEIVGCQNSGGNWNIILKSCDCPIGTQWDKDKLICVNLSQIGCESSGGEWTGEMCKCKEGFIWDDKLLQCIKSEVSINEETCLNGGGIWDGSNCKCEDGFIWDEKELKCMESGGGVDEKTCINGGGEWTGKECICPEGTTWDEKELKCVEK